MSTQTGRIQPDKMPDNYLSRFKKDELREYIWNKEKKLQKEREELYIYVRSFQARIEGLKGIVKTVENDNYLWLIASQLREIIEVSNGKHLIECSRDEYCNCIEDSARELLNIVDLSE